MSRYIAPLALVLAFGLSGTAEGAPLTRAERVVCENLGQCLDIVARHDASEFDYDVLAKAFARFGPRGRAGLFRILDGKAGTADVAELIAQGGALSAQEWAWVKRSWTVKTTAKLLPLALDGTLRGRDLLLKAAGHPDIATRKTALRGLAGLSPNILNASLSPDLQTAVLAAASTYPDPTLAPFVLRIDTKRDRERFEALLLSAEPQTVTAAYASLYRQAPGPAFQVLLKQLRSAKTAEQAEALGFLIAERHQKRSDGFYAAFAADISGDESFPPFGRAAGLHAYFLTLANRPKSKLPKIPAYTPVRKAALDALMRRPSSYLNTYAAGLAGQSDPVAQALLGGLWSAALQSRRQDLSRILDTTRRVPNRGRLLQAQIQTGHPRDVRAALRELKDAPVPALSRTVEVVSQTHPLVALRQQAAGVLQLAATAIGPERFTCPFPIADLADKAQQMPFFDAGEDGINRVGDLNFVVARRALATAHPTASGWLAGYNGGESAHGLVHFDNRTGQGQPIPTGVAANVLAVLPEKALPLGQTANRFWVVTDSAIGQGVEVWQIPAKDLKAERITTLLDIPNKFGVDRAGNLFVSFDAKAPLPVQPPLVINASGALKLACREATVPGRLSPAPN